MRTRARGTQSCARTRASARAPSNCGATRRGARSRRLGKGSPTRPLHPRVSVDAPRALQDTRTRARIPRRGTRTTTCAVTGSRFLCACPKRPNGYVGGFPAFLKRCIFCRTRRKRRGTRRARRSARAARRQTNPQRCSRGSGAPARRGHARGGPPSTQKAPRRYIHCWSSCRWGGYCGPLRLLALRSGWCWRCRHCHCHCVPVALHHDAPGVLVFHTEAKRK